MKLYSYWRSSAAYRVRIALNLKGLEYEVIPVHLLKDGGQQLQDGYRSLNPQGLIPTLADDAVNLGQSLAIMDYLETRYPEPALYPKTPEERAFVPSNFALAVACDIHPLNNLRVLKYIKRTLKLDDEAKNVWIHHWITNGFTALENTVERQELGRPLLC